MSDDEPRTPAVLDGVLQYTSVSAIKKFKDCPAQWYFRYVLGMPDKPPSKGQKRGIEGHKRLEHYLKTGQDVLNKLERMGISRGYVPAPGPDLSVEEHFGKPSPLLALDVPMKGFIDLVNPRFLSAGTLEITDWKFKKDIAKYGAKPGNLTDPHHEDGIQMLGYGEWARLQPDRFPMARVTLRHVTFQTEKRDEVVEAPTTVGLTVIKSGWETVSRSIIPRMKAVARASTFHEVPKSLEACTKYGGCPYQSTCLDPMARLVNGFKTHAVRKESTSMGMLDQMTKKAQPIHSESPAACAAPAVPQPAPAKTPLINDIPAGAIEAGQAEQGKDYAVNGVTLRFLCGTQLGTTRYMSFTPVAGGAPVLITPETAIYPLVPAAPAPVPAQALPLVLPPDAPKSNPALASKPQSAPAPVAPPPALAAEPKKRGPGRPRKEDSAPADAAVSAAEPIHTQAGGGKMDGVHLYFGAFPVGISATPLGAYVDALEAKIIQASQTNITDLRVAQDGTLGFGKWKGYLAKASQEEPPAPGHYLVTAGDERVQAVGEALLAICIPGNAVVGR